MHVRLPAGILLYDDYLRLATVLALTMTPKET